MLFHVSESSVKMNMLSMNPYKLTLIISSLALSLSFDLKDTSLRDQNKDRLNIQCLTVADPVGLLGYKLLILL